MHRLNNMYYAKYDSSVESLFYDSDNPEAQQKLYNSPSQVDFVKIITRREREELLYKMWIEKISDSKFAQEITEKCGMMVRLSKHQVRYTYEPIIHCIPGIKFRVTIMYQKLCRKWYISSGYTRLPDMIQLKKKLEKGVYDPTGSKVLALIRKVKNILDPFVLRLQYVYEFIDNINNNYKDIEFAVSPSAIKLKATLKERGWPNDLEKTFCKDAIVLEFTFDEHQNISELSYEYMCKQGAPKHLKEATLTKIDHKLHLFFDYPFKEAFKKFLEG